MKKKKVLYIVSNIFSHHIADTFYPSPSIFTSLPPIYIPFPLHPAFTPSLRCTSLHFPSLHLFTILDDFHFTSLHFTTLFNDKDGQSMQLITHNHLQKSRFRLYEPTSSLPLNLHGLPRTNLRLHLLVGYF